MTWWSCRLLLLYASSSDNSSSTSVESLDIDCVDDGFHLEPEPEAWSVTVDKGRLETMSARDIKRQDHIWGSWTLCLSHSDVQNTPKKYFENTK